MTTLNKFKNMPDKNSQPFRPPNAREFLKRHAEALAIANLCNKAGPRLLDHKKRLAALHSATQIQLNHDRFRTLFYPCSATDWKPLQYLNRTCDLFIFCDWEIEASAVPDDLWIPGLKQVTSFSLDQETVDHLNDKSLLPSSWKDKIEAHKGPKPWGKYASFNLVNSNDEELVHAFFFGMEAVNLFANLFLPVKAAPEVLCLWNAPGMSGWTNFHSIKAPLGQLVSKCSLWPRYIVGDQGDWNYPKPVKLVPGRNRIVNQRFRAYER